MSLAVPKHVVFDIDGTLCMNGADMDYDDVASILRHSRPIVPAVRRLAQLLDLGLQVSFITGRHRKVRQATHKQLREWFGDRAVVGTDIFHREFAPYELMECIAYKYDALRFLEPDFYVGDLDMDQTAAAAAGVPFFPAEWFRDGKSFTHLLNDDFKPANVRDMATKFGYHDEPTWDAILQAEGREVALASAGQRAIEATAILHRADSVGHLAGVQATRVGHPAKDVEVAKGSGGA